ncbi:hypothetical protein JQ581_31615 [Bradyrhizobium liaoningense]|uniref:hypothetical protein n=1 Tax=Bradyrhizobium liaoningense TaxID=43992 RepID=UPI001BA4F587|nr:hypothetical protein [Bradyrhizobium liaoningense]MBR0741491.1 hypothetical protein [Bradyrhizobium liaoningense]
MPAKTISQETSRNPSETGPPRSDKPRETHDAIIEDAGTGDEDRDLVHGEGGAIDLPTKPGDLSKDD